MTYGRIASIQYQTPEQAATMAAQINSSEQGNTIRAFSNGRVVEILPSNPALVDLFAFFFKVSKNVALFISKFADSAEKNGHKTTVTS